MGMLMGYVSFGEGKPELFQAFWVTWAEVAAIGQEDYLRFQKYPKDITKKNI